MFFEKEDKEKQKLYPYLYIPERLKFGLWNQWYFNEEKEKIIVKRIYYI